VGNLRKGRGGASDMEGKRGGRITSKGAGLKKFVADGQDAQGVVERYDG